MIESDTGAKQLAWIKALHECENRDNIPRLLDVNGKYSYAYLMFQKSTFDLYGGKYGLPHDNIYSKEQQELIALYMLNEGLSKNWYNCSKVLGQYPLNDISQISI